jgi:selenocysteine lyase/cysteine desulfurase
VSVNWDEVRAQFPPLARWTYLNTATFGQLPQCAQDAAARHFEHRNELACSDFLAWYDEMDRIRGKAARLIHAQPEDIAFIPNAATGLGLVLSGLDWLPGDRIVTLEHEFPNNLYGPAFLRRRGVETLECPWERFYESVDERTRLVVLSSVNYNSGFVPPLVEISEFLRRKGVLFFVDGTQSVGALEFDAGRVQPSVLSVHGYKWLNSPYGAGFLYIPAEVRELLTPPIIGWRSHYDWRNVDNLHHGAPQLPAGAERFEGGGLPVSLLYAMEASIDLVLDIGPAVIERRVLDLAEQTRAMLRDLGAAVNCDASPVVAARFEGVDVSRLALDLQERRIVVAARRGHLRVSPHFYNNEADIEQLGGALKDWLRERRK